MTENDTASAESVPDIDVRLTPRPSDGSGATERRSLNGTWEFAPGTDEPPSDDDEWRRHEVPGQWNYAGYEVPDDGRGWYRRTIQVPSDRASGPVKIRFNGVYSDAIVRVNGERVRLHQGGYTPFEVDVTDALEIGDDNVLEVGVAEKSKAESLSQTGFGAGITRGVTLLSVPPCHLADLDIETTVEDDDEGTIAVEAMIRNAGPDRIDNARMRATLTDPDGTAVETLESSIDGLGDEDEQSVSFEFTVDGAATWNPEQPRLYELSCEVEANGESERVEASVGIREFEIDGDQLLLNGRPITLRGVNWRECHPDHGLAIPAERTRRDAELLREANVNYVRTGHHPTTEAFVEACDELGIVVEMEAPIAFLRFENSHLATDPSYREPLCRQILEIVERDKNRTSVGIWSLANESEWGPNFEAAAELVSAADPTRPTTFNWGMHKDEDAPYVDIANHHYPALRDSKVDLEEFEESDRPVMFGEFCHTYCYNVRELGTDPGLRDDYVRVLERGWERVNELDAFAGAAIWAGLDHLTPEYRWGLIDAHRRRRPEYWHVKNVYAPIKIESVRRTGDLVQVDLDNRSQFVSLSDRRLEWRAGDESGTFEADVPPGETGTVTIDPPADGSSITVKVLHPAGFTIDEHVFEDDDHTSRPNAPMDDPTVTESETKFMLETPDCSVTVDRNIGEVEIAGPDGEPIVSGLLGFGATSVESNIRVPPIYGDTIGTRLSPWRCEAVRTTDDETGVEIQGGYYYDTIDIATGSFHLRFAGDHLELAYEFTFNESRDVRQAGLVIPVVRDCDTLSWVRDSYWSAYPSDHIGRSTGSTVAFPGGERAANDNSKLDGSWLWCDEATENGSNDFRSTKRHIREATLSGSDGRAIDIYADGDQHVRCSVEGDTIDLNVLDRSLAGVGLGLLDRHALLDEEPTIEAGTRFEGRVKLGIQNE
ncbi:hypothetical protein OB955_22490 [Halobacteria archaeon AArc-m2/3/4]|uniref:beta-galactosidase n=1 Tax=Natronoglomus mannanivorans TaxID=2979990 RepID=A0ABT2QKP8_9EURY|nr:hypothetical protein [Halobacteria archaeon AArc-m2/3/4]